MSIAQHEYNLAAIERNRAIKEAVYAKTFLDEQAARRWVRDIKGDTKSDGYTAAVKQFEESLSTVSDVLNGRENGVLARYKTVTGPSGLMPQQTIQTFLINQDELLLDMEWMAVYGMADLTQGFRGSMETILQNFIFEQVNDSTDPAPAGSWSRSEWENFTGEYFKGGVKVANELLEKDPLTALNLIFTAARIKVLEKKTADAYTAMNAAITVAAGASQTTAYVNSVQETITKAKTALLRKNKGKGWGLSQSMAIRIFAAGELEGKIEAAFGSFAPVTNNVTNNYRVVGNFSRHYSLNLAPQLGLGGADRAVLVLPRIKCHHLQFRNMKMAQGVNISTDTTDIVALEGRTFITESDQFWVVSLA
jgi:hypothetical protein